MESREGDNSNEGMCVAYIYTKSMLSNRQREQFDS